MVEAPFDGFRSRAPSARGRTRAVESGLSVNADETREHRLAVMTGWAFFGSFGICLILSGFSESSMVAGLAGFAALIAGFVSHIVLNSIYRVGFTQPQIALGLGAFAVGVFCWLASVLFNPGFREIDVATGLVGFSALAAAFVVYIIINYGVRGSYQMVNRMHAEERPRS
jgi:hypothetical protein